MNYNLIPIGECKEENGEFVIEIYPKYRKAMEGLAEHSYLKIIWWFDKCDDEISRNKLIETSVYKGYKRDKIEMRVDRAEVSDFPLYLNMVAGGFDCGNQTIGGFSFVVKINAVPVIKIIG